MEPMVLQAPSFPATEPLSPISDMVYLMRDGVTVPSRKRGKTNMIMQAAKEDHIRSPVETVTIIRPVMASMMYLPRTGMKAIHMAAISILVKSLSGPSPLSAHFPPITFPRAMAIIMVPMIMVHTICDDEKYGASSLDAPSSTAITAIPAKNSVMYK